MKDLKTCLDHLMSLLDKQRSGVSQDQHFIQDTMPAPRCFQFSGWSLAG